MEVQLYHVLIPDCPMTSLLSQFVFVILCIQSLLSPALDPGPMLPHLSLHPAFLFAWDPCFLGLPLLCMSIHVLSTLAFLDL